jgi:hypothetical protein
MWSVVPKHAVCNPAMQCPNECDHIRRECSGKIFSKLSPEGIEEIIKEGAVPRFVFVTSDKFDAII